LVEKSYLQMLDVKERIRVRFKKDRGRIVEFVVQYETLVRDEWMAIVRYDTAHGQPHTDVFKPDGTKAKTLLHFPNYNDAFSYAEEDVRTNWENYRRRYFAEVKRE